MHPGEITLLAIGPMTNVALLFSIDPEIPKLLKQLVLMCGVFTNQLAGVGPLEWNAICDPYATAIIYKAPVKIHKSVGLDVTCQVTMSREEVEQNFKADILKPVADFAEVFFEKAKKLTFHDPLAAAVIFDENICTFKKGKVDIELASSRLKGMTCWKASDDGEHEIALEVDRNRFLEHYFSVVNGR
jgi:inosine-uridine nucleoside N-ribohydrolase